MQQVYTLEDPNNNGIRNTSAFKFIIYISHHVMYGVLPRMYIVYLQYMCNNNCSAIIIGSGWGFTGMHVCSFFCKLTPK